MSERLRVLGVIYFLFSIGTGVMAYIVIGTIQVPTMDGLNISFHEEVNWTWVLIAICCAFQGFLVQNVLFAIASLMDDMSLMKRRTRQP